MRQFYIALETVYPYSNKLLFGWTESVILMKQLQCNYRAGNLTIEIYTCNNIVEFASYIHTEYDCSVGSVVNYHMSFHYSHDTKIWMIVKDAYKDIFCSNVMFKSVRQILFDTMLRYALFDKYLYKGVLSEILPVCNWVQSNCGLDPVYLLIFLDTIEYQGSVLPLPETDESRIDSLIGVALCSIVFGRN